MDVLVALDTLEVLRALSIYVEHVFDRLRTKEDAIGQVHGLAAPASD